MTENRRIFFNIVATYGRSLFALVCGLFTARWVLMSLGQVDYGLYGVIGGLTAFIAFFNTVLATSVGRFYAFSVGQMRVRGEEAQGLATCRQWFTVALVMHVCVATVLSLVGYPIGEWAVRNWLTIPPERIEACVWVWRFTCISVFAGMVGVPFQAMYTAKQYIAELTVYSFITTILNVCFGYYMISHPGDWLVRFSLWAMVLATVPSVIISLRALAVFPECRVLRGYLWHWPSIRRLVLYSGWNFFGAMGNLLRGAGMTVLVNKFLGPVRNASVTIATTVSGHAQGLSGSIVEAFMPAITTACGAGNRTRMVKLVHMTCKFGAALLLPFLVPLAVEIDSVMVIWLQTPPAGAGELCLYIFINLLLDKVTTGHWIAVAANGKIAWYQLAVGSCFILTLPIAALLMVCGLDIAAVGISLILTLAVVVVIRLIAVKVLLGISSRYWLLRIFLPLLGTLMLTAAVGMVPRLFLEASLLRVCLTAAVCETVLLPCLWFLVLDREEQTYLLERIRAVRRRV